MPRHRLAAATALAAALGASPVAGGEVAGWVERVCIEPPGLALDAKLDTGADHSSIGAVAVRRFQRGGQAWIGFTIEAGSGEGATLERPVLRVARIRTAVGVLERPVVRLAIRLGDVLQSAEVNVADRAGLRYPMLLGRSYLAGRFVVDPGARRLTRTRCAPADGRAVSSRADP